MLIELTPKCFLGLECKAAAEVDVRALKAFDSIRKNYGDAALSKGAVICRTEKAYPLGQKNAIRAIPVSGKNGLTDWLETQL